MAEARSAVGTLRVPPTLEEGRNSWKDFAVASRKAIVRTYYRTRNSIRNGTWPTSTSNLSTGIILTYGIMLMYPESAERESGVASHLWRYSHCLHLPEGVPHWVRAFVVSVLFGFVFFLVVMKLRQFVLQALLSYRGWLYENPRTTSKKTLLWGLVVRLVSGYQPSLYSCQRSLPRLPVPPLHSTIEKLLKSLEPLCSEEELESLRTQAQEFEKNLGPKLQRILALKSWWAPNYVSDWWEKYVYLMSRTPLAINSNYYCMGNKQWTPTHLNTSRAACVIHLMSSFSRMISREQLQPLVLRNTIPICMAQYERLFSTTRIPCEDVDTLLHWDTTYSRHIIVQAFGVYYVVDIIDHKNQILSPTALEEQLEWIWNDAKQATEGVGEEERSVAALTSLPRPEWAKTRKDYFSSSQNKESLDLVETAMFMVILSSESPTGFSSKGKWLLHGDGRSLWFDKSINIVFFADGNCGVNVEHSMADAPALGHAWEYAMTREILEKLYAEDGRCMPSPSNFVQGEYRRPTRLYWDVSSQDLAAKISRATSLAQKSNNDVDLAIVEHSAWGKGVIKKFRVSPDAFVQMALQLAYYRDSGRFVQTYEATMARLFLHGRTETVRSCTNEAKQFVLAMSDPTVPTNEKLRLLRVACDQHQSLYRDAMTGKGIDRHLFALYVCCKGLGYESPFLESVLSRPWTLSTSQQPQQQQAVAPDINLPVFRDKVSPGGGFGPVSDDGYGVSYMFPSDHLMFFHISSKHSSQRTDSTRFAKEIFKAFDDMKALLKN